MAKPLTALLIETPNPAQSAEFYTKVLGVSFEQGQNEVWRGMLGDLSIIIRQAEQPNQIVGVSFEVSDIDATSHAVTQLGGGVNLEKHEGPFGLVANLKDPDGLPIEVIQLHK